MKRLIINYALLIVGAIGAVSCQESNVDELTTSQPIEGSVMIEVAAPSTPTTKINFTDNGTEGIDLKWEAGDTFTLYNYPTMSGDGVEDDDDSRIGNFTCISVDDDGVGLFAAEDGVTINNSDNEAYVAYYPAVSVEHSSEAHEELQSNIPNQDGDDIDNLKNSCIMGSLFHFENGKIVSFDMETEEYVTSETQTISFFHQSAIMTFKFKSDVRPAKLLFEIGSDIYTVNFTDIVPDAETGLYTSHIAIDGYRENKYLLRFSLYANAEDSEPYDVREVESNIEIRAGVRYTAPISNLPNKAIWSGKGTEESPYIISTREDLDKMNANIATFDGYKGIYFLLNNDIDLGGIVDSAGVESAKFTPIGNDTNKFGGVFKGDYNVISGLYINSTGLFNALFYITDGATITDLAVEGIVIGTNYSAGIVGSADFGTKIINCYNNATVNGAAYVGGIAGHAHTNATFEECGNWGDITGDYNVGGITGRIATSSKIESCSNIGGVTGTYNIGGMTGQSQDNVQINGCINRAGVSSISTTAETFVGGLIGRADENIDVYACINRGEVNGHHHVGGLIGQAFDATVTSCCNIGNINGTGNNIGGLVGRFFDNSSATNCYSAAWRLTGRGTTPEDQVGSERVGLFIGEIEADTSTAVDCYYLADVDDVYSPIGNNSEIVITPKNDTQMREPGMVELLNASLENPIWVCDDENEENHGYPTFP